MAVRKRIVVSCRYALRGGLAARARAGVRGGGLQVHTCRQGWGWGRFTITPGKVLFLEVSPPDAFLQSVQISKARCPPFGEFLHRSILHNTHFHWAVVGRLCTVLCCASHVCVCVGGG